MVFTHRDKLILSAIIALFAVRLVTIHTIQLSPDEAYYWNWGQHPSLAYSDHPPMVAWLMAFFHSPGRQRGALRPPRRLFALGSGAFLSLCHRKDSFPRPPGPFLERSSRIQRDAALSRRLHHPDAGHAHALLLGCCRLVREPHRGGRDRMVVVRLGSGTRPGPSEQVHHDPSGTLHLRVSSVSAPRCDSGLPGKNPGSVFCSHLSSSHPSFTGTHNTTGSLLPTSSGRGSRRSKRPYP